MRSCHSHFCRLLLAGAVTTFLPWVAADAQNSTEGLPGNNVLSLRPQRLPDNASETVRPWSFTAAEVDEVRNASRALDDPGAIRSVLEAIGDARIVLLGESTHGTSEFYRFRAELTRLLIEANGFDAVALEADAGAAAQASRAVQKKRGQDEGEPMRDEAFLEKALSGFDSFPEWVWNNREFAGFLEWVSHHNQSRHAPADRIAIYGLDLYRPEQSAQAVIDFLETAAPELADEARHRYECVFRFAGRWDDYGEAAIFGQERRCSQDIALQESAILSHRLSASPAWSEARRQASLVRHAEAYYRASRSGGHAAWNIRDTHMADTLAALLEEISRRKGRPARIVVWAHNSHVGDARATAAGEQGEITLGQLVRERYGSDQTFLLGFSTYRGDVMAAPAWGEPARQMKLQPALAGSIAQLFHDTGLPALFLDFDSVPETPSVLGGSHPERMVGVVYRPQTERQSHYLPTRLSRRFDGVVHIDRTRAVEMRTESSSGTSPP